MVLIRLKNPQITPSSVRLIDGKSLTLTDTFVPPESKKVNVCAMNKTQVLISVGGGHLYYFEVEGKKLVQKG